MTIILSSENILLIGSILIFTSIVISKTGYKLGLPALLLFLTVGMLFGEDGIGLVFNNYKQTQFLGIIALSVILFTGGIETKFKDIKPVLRQGVVLSTIGIVLTTLLCGGFIYLAGKYSGITTPIPFVICLIMASVMSSTDSASVFNILKNSKMKLKENLRPILELESGSNDPMAYCLTILLIETATLLYGDGHTGIHYGDIAMKAMFTLVKQIFVGSLIGVIIGYVSIWVLHRIQLLSTPLYAILLLSIAIFTISITEIIHGNGYLAVYIAGLIIGNSAFPRKKEILKFLDGMTWLMQIVIFLTLGLLVRPHEMLPLIPLGIALGLFTIFIARPVTVFLCLLPFRKMSTRAKIYISWVGLKGAVPIIFAIYPIMVHVPMSDKIFNVVYFMTIMSLVLQGITVKPVAKLLKLDLPEDKTIDTFGIVIPEEAGKLLDYTIKENDLADGHTLKEINLPEGARAVMINRDNRHIVPDGNVRLQAGDKLLLIFGDYSEDD